MPITPIIKSLYPHVPQVAGVPALLRAGAQIFDTLTLGFLGAGELVNQIIGSEPVRWGVFDSTGKAIAQYDSVASMDYRSDSRVSDYPIENGSFASFNKVDQPFTISVLLRCAGDDTRRNTFQNDLRDARASLTLYTVIVPDGTFTNCNLVALDWQRTTERGANVINAYCEFQEIRQRGTTAFSQTQDPSGASPTEIGQVQAIDDSVIDTSGIA